MATEARGQSRTYPAEGAVELDTLKSDSTDLVLSRQVRAFYVGGYGDVKITTTDGDTVTFKGFQEGSLMPCSIKRLWSTGTTATAIIGLY